MALGIRLLSDHHVAKAHPVGLLLMTFERAAIRAGLVRQDLAAIEFEHCSVVHVALERIGQRDGQVVAHAGGTCCEALISSPWACMMPPRFLSKNGIGMPICVLKLAPGEFTV